MSSDPDDQDTGSAPEIGRFAFAMFDVLGFSNWVETTSLESILSQYRQLIEKAVLEPSEEVSLTAFHTSEGMLFAIASPPSYAYFSDTILLWCPLEPPLVSVFVERCSDVICEALNMNIPLRGAITLGEAVLDNDTNTYIGDPIVEAAKLEKGQDWIGLTFGESAMWPPFIAQLHGASVIEYSAPMKSGYQKFASPVVVDWPRRWRDNRESDLIEHLDSLNESSQFSKYYDNAKEFADYSASNHDWFKNPEEIPPDAELRLAPLSEFT